MRTTVDIPDSVFRTAKRVAVEKGCTLRDLVTEALRHELAGRPTSGRASRRPLPAISLPENAPILHMTPERLAELDMAADMERVREICR